MLDAKYYKKGNKKCSVNEMKAILYVLNWHTEDSHTAPLPCICEVEEQQGRANGRAVEGPTVELR
jgi:hypothetical protein